MKSCMNCARENSDDAIICANCGASFQPSRSQENLPKDSGGWVGCLIVVAAILDLLALPFLLLELWPGQEFAIAPPVWGKIAYFAVQIGALALMIHYYRSAVKRGAGPQTRTALLLATILAAIILGLGTMCTASLFSS